MNLVMFWATVLSPVIGAIAIGVALYISHKSSKDVQKQIDAVYNLLDVFVATQNPSMIEAKQKYEQQLSLVKQKIRIAKENLVMAHSPFMGRGPKIEDIETNYEVSQKQLELESLLEEQKELENKITVIQSYLDKVKK